MYHTHDQVVVDHRAKRISTHRPGRISGVVAAQAIDPCSNMSTLFWLDTIFCGSTVAMAKACTALILGIDFDGHRNSSDFDNEVPVQRRFHPVGTDMRLIVLRQWLKNGY